MVDVSTGGGETGVPRPQRRITIQLILKVVARENRLTVPGLLERTRRIAVARPRQIAMYLAATLTKASLPDIGDRFGGFDHTTVIYARDRILDLMGRDARIRTEVERLKSFVLQANAGDGAEEHH